MLDVSWLLRQSTVIRNSWLLSLNYSVYFYVRLFKGSWLVSKIDLISVLFSCQHLQRGSQKLVGPCLRSHKDKSELLCSSASKGINRSFSIWRSGDAPSENYPATKNYESQICHNFCSQTLLTGIKSWKAPLISAVILLKENFMIMTFSSLYPPLLYLEKKLFYYSRNDD